MKRPPLSIWMIIFVIAHASVTIGCGWFFLDGLRFSWGGGPDPYEAFRTASLWTGLILAFPFVYLAFMFSGALMPVSVVLGLATLLFGVLGNSTFWWFQIRLITEDWWKSRGSHTAHLPESIELPVNYPEA